MIKYENLRKQVLDAILEAVEQGLITGTSGNIALRDDNEDIVAITPSGIPYKGMKIQTFIRVAHAYCSAPCKTGYQSNRTYTCNVRYNYGNGRSHRTASDHSSAV